MDVIEIKDLQAQWAERVDGLLDGLARGEGRVILSRDGAPAAALVSLDDLRRLQRLDHPPLERREDGAVGAVEGRTLFDTLLLHAPIGLAFFDRKHCYVLINDALARINGLPVEAHLGHSIGELLPAMADRLGSLLDQVFETGQAVRDLEIAGEIPVAPGEERHWITGFYPVRVSDRVAYVGSFVVEITDRKRAEKALCESEQQVMSILESISDIFFSLDRQWRFTYANQHALKVAGLTAEQILGREIWQLWPALLGTEVEAAYRRAMEERIPVQLEVKGVVSGSWFETNVYPSEEGLSVYGRDVTESKRARQALRALTERLEARVQERTQQVRALASALTLAEQRERHRVAQILHEDLQQLLFGAQVQLSILQGLLPAREAAASGGVLTQVSDILKQAISVTRTLTVDLSPPVLRNEGLAEAVRWLAVQMQQVHGLDVDVKVDGVLDRMGESMRVLLFQLVRELLFNVVKHAGVDRVRVDMNQADGHIRVRVEDEGAGFNVQDLDASSGTGGFGLYSIQERLDLFGGRLELDSTEGRGTCATIIAPVHTLKV